MDVETREIIRALESLKKQLPEIVANGDFEALELISSLHISFLEAKAKKTAAILERLEKLYQQQMEYSLQIGHATRLLCNLHRIKTGRMMTEEDLT